MRHFPLHLILLLGTILTLGACGERQAYREALSRAEAAMGEATDKHEENMRQLRMLESVHRMDYESEKARLLAENDELQKQIKDLQKEKAISKHLATSEAFAKETIVKRFREIDNNPITSVTDTEWYELTMVRLLHERSIRI